MFQQIYCVEMGTLCFINTLFWNVFSLFIVGIGTLCFNWDIVLNWHIMFQLRHNVEMGILCVNWEITFQSIHCVEMCTLCFINTLCWNVYICLSHYIVRMGTLCFNQYIVLKLVHHISINTSCCNGLHYVSINILLDQPIYCFEMGYTMFHEYIFTLYWNVYTFFSQYILLELEHHVSINTLWLIYG